MRERARWRVQAQWTVDGEERRYAPVFVASVDAAARTAREIEATLAHFVGLRVRIDEVTGAEADAEEAALDAQRADAPAPLLHVYADGDRSRARCGATPGASDALLAEDLFALSTGRTCPTCRALAR